MLNLYSEQTYMGFLLCYLNLMGLILIIWGYIFKCPSQPASGDPNGISISIVLVTKPSNCQWESAVGQIQISLQPCIFVSLQPVIQWHYQYAHMQMNLGSYSKNVGKAHYVHINPSVNIYIFACIMYEYLLTLLLPSNAAIKCNYGSDSNSSTENVA